MTVPGDVSTGDRPAPPLGGLRVAERACGLAASYATFLLAGLGATVEKCPAPGTPPLPGSVVLDRTKVVVDPQAWAACVAGADAVVTDGPLDGLHPPRLLRCHLTGPGDRGPLRHLPDDDALLGAATGVQGTQWSWSGRPVWLVTPMIQYMTGALAALGVVAAALARERGVGGQEIRVSGLQGALALQSGSYVTGPRHQGSLLHAGDPRGAYPTYGLYRAADGWLLIGALTQAFWVKLATVLDRLDLLVDERLAASPLTFGAPGIRAFLRAELEPIFARATTAAWVSRLRAADIPCAAVGTRGTFLADPEARALGLAVPVDDPRYGTTWQPGAPARFLPSGPPTPQTVPRVVAPRPVPRTCLEGVRVIDFSSFIAGPFCPMLLADLGADVVKVESPEGDPFRLAAFAFVGWNRGKRSLVLDLKRPGAAEVFLDLVRTADVVVDNVRVGVMERLGIGWERMRSVNPGLIHTSITGFGIDGPLATLPGFDPVFQARSGFMQAQGGDDEPVFHTIAYNDYSAGTLAALATVAALVARERTGAGCRVDVSLFRTAFIDQAATMVLGAPVAQASGGRDFLGPSAARRLYRCVDGWVCISAATAPAIEGLGRVVGSVIPPDAVPDGPVAEAVAARLVGLDRATALSLLACEGVPAAACLGIDEVFSDPHLRANDAFSSLDDTALGEVVLGGPLMTFEKTPVVYRSAAPGLGADAAEVLEGIGYPGERIASLMDDGIVGRPR